MYTSPLCQQLAQTIIPMHTHNHTFTRVIYLQVPKRVHTISYFTLLSQCTHTTTLSPVLFISPTHTSSYTCTHHVIFLGGGLVGWSIDEGNPRDDPSNQVSSVDLYLYHLRDLPHLNQQTWREREGGGGGSAITDMPNEYSNSTIDLLK